VDSVMVDGRFIKRQGRLLGFDVPKIIDHAKHSALRIRKAAGGVLTPISDAPGNPVFKASCC
jgi:5-methylthioadenosine/S-adenosylhomocysteine deaminase